jgi:hypothetical protein
MIKLGQIVDTEYKGLHYLEDYQGRQHVIPQLTMTQSFDVEVLEFDESNNPIQFIEAKTLELNLNIPSEKSIRERLTELAGL